MGLTVHTDLLFVVRFFLSLNSCLLWTNFTFFFFLSIKVSDDEERMSVGSKSNIRVSISVTVYVVPFKPSVLSVKVFVVGVYECVLAVCCLRL